MYTRNYYSEHEKITVPENYDGNAFHENKEVREAKAEQAPSVKEELPPLRAPWDVPKETSEDVAEKVMTRPKTQGNLLGELMTNLPFGSFLRKGDFFKNAFSDFGTEEILLIGVALFLLLSKSGDKECAFILLFLLFVK